MFQLLDPRHVRLRHINLRTEKHGKRDVDAVDLEFVVEGGNADVLGLLDDRLCDALFLPPEMHQEPVEGVPPVPKKLRFPRLGAFPWDLKCSAMDLVVSWGIEEDDPIEFHDGKVAVKTVKANDGGHTFLGWTFSTTMIPDGALDKLRKKQKQMVKVTLIQNERVRTEAVEGGPVIDGRRGPDAGDLLAAEHGDAAEGAGGVFGGEPIGGDVDTTTIASLDSETRRAVTQNGPHHHPRTERGREQTRKALESGAQS